jgi:hypothetical protein
MALQMALRLSPPANELPAGVALTVLLGRTDDAAVGITQIEAFSTGFRFTLAVRVRRALPALAHGGLLTLINSYLPDGLEIAVEDRLHLGIEYTGGSWASNLLDMAMPDSGAVADGQRLVLVQQGGGGREQSADMTYWLAPLPPEGPVTFVLAWPGFGMPASRTVLDSAAIRAAAERSHILWPPQPSTGSPDPGFPPNPSAGLFADPSG